MTHETLRTARQLYADEFYDDAIPVLKRVLARDSLLLDAWCYLGFALLAVDRVDDAVAAFCRGLELSAQDTSLMYGYGLSMYQARQFDTALSCFCAVIQIDSEHGLARKMAVKVLVEQAQEALLQYRYESGRQMLERAVEISPSEPAPYLQMVRSCLESAHHGLAQNWVELGVQNCPDSVDLIQLAARMGLVKPPASQPVKETATPIPDIFLKNLGKAA